MVRNAYGVCMSYTVLAHDSIGAICMYVLHCACSTKTQHNGPYPCPPFSPFSRLSTKNLALHTYINIYISTLNYHFTHHLHLHQYPQSHISLSLSLSSSLSTTPIPPPPQCPPPPPPPRPYRPPNPPRASYCTRCTTARPACR